MKLEMLSIENLTLHLIKVFIFISKTHVLISGQIQVNKNAVADRIIHIENNAINKNSKTYDQALRTNILLDIKHSNNPQYLQEYVDEIFEDLHKTEVNFFSLFMSNIIIYKSFIF